MRNSKVKGFTLIELIVVIAIIGILAAILVPSMLGYVRNARISSANAGAKQVHTAVASALTQLGISNWDFGGDNKEKKLTIKGDGKGTITVDCDASNPPDATVWDFGSYLGDEFGDYGVAFFNSEAYSVLVAGYATTTGGNTKITSYANADAMRAVSETDQKADAKAGTIYGIYPAPKAQNAGN